jgi:hypothetical protein
MSWASVSNGRPFCSEDIARPSKRNVFEHARLLVEAVTRSGVGYRFLLFGHFYRDIREQGCA